MPRGFETAGGRLECREALLEGGSARAIDGPGAVDQADAGRRLHAAQIVISCCRRRGRLAGAGEREDALDVGQQLTVFPIDARSFPRSLTGLGDARQDLPGASVSDSFARRNVDRLLRCCDGLVPRLSGFEAERLPDGTLDFRAGRLLAAIATDLPDEEPAPGGDQDKQRSGGETQGAAPGLALEHGLRLGGDRVELGLSRTLLDACEERRDPIGDGAGIARPVTRHWLQTAEYERLHCLVGIARVDPAMGLFEARLPCRQQLIADWTRVRGLAGEDLAQDRAESKHVGPLVEFLGAPHGLLGGHVRGGAHHASLDGLRPDGAGSHGRNAREIRRSSRLVSAEHLGEPPVDDLHLAERADHHVRGFEVTVDHPARVGVGHGLSDLFVDGDQVDPLGIAVKQFGERPALNQLHGEARAAVRLEPETVDRNDAGVLKLPPDLGLLHEPLDDVLVLRVVPPQDLQRDVPVQVLVAAPVDHTDSAAGNLPKDLVARVVLCGLVAITGDGDRGVDLVRLA